MHPYHKSAAERRIVLCSLPVNAGSIPGPQGIIFMYQGRHRLVELLLTILWAVTTQWLPVAAVAK